MKLLVTYNDGYTTQRQTYTSADTFDIDVRGNLLILKNDRPTPLGMYASGTWNNVYEM